MARPELANLAPKLPRWEEMDPANFWMRYDEPTDTLIISFFGQGRAAVSKPVGEHGYLRVDPASNEIVGLMFEEFISVIAGEHPALLDSAVRLGMIESALAEQFRRQFHSQNERQEFVTSLMRELVPMYA